MINFDFKSEKKILPLTPFAMFLKKNIFSIEDFKLNFAIFMFIHVSSNLPGFLTQNYFWLN